MVFVLVVVFGCSATQHGGFWTAADEKNCAVFVFDLAAAAALLVVVVEFSSIATAVFSMVVNECVIAKNSDASVNLQHNLDKNIFRIEKTL